MAHDVDAIVFVGSASFLLARRVPARCRLLFHEVDPLSLAWEADAQRATTWMACLRHRLRAFRARSLERWAAARGTLVLVSPQDAQRASAALRVDVRSVTIGADVAADAVAPDPQRPVVAYVGNLSWEPNVASVRFLVDEVWPKVLADHPEAVLRVIGAAAAPSVRALARPGIEVHVDVRSIEAALQGSWLAAFPGGFGWGVRGSVLSAMGAGVAVVASPAAACGFPHAGQLVVVEDEHLANEVVRLLGDGEARAQLAIAGRRFMSSWPSWRDIARQLVELAIA
jgi:glycosyltransferase involved in cell wall biosynthesis